MNNYKINYLVLKVKNNSKMNLILKMEFYQVKDHLEKYINAKIQKTINIMQLNCYKLMKDLVILMKLLQFIILKIV